MVKRSKRVKRVKFPIEIENRKIGHLYRISKMVHLAMMDITLLIESNGDLYRKSAYKVNQDFWRAVYKFTGISESGMYNAVHKNGKVVITKQGGK